ncbi:Uu.00g116260.m01.CDS01 [Anthostomella pinea]|uniref:Uu.00g116260.m01.CDS01 n=1 Tax=Anthostomella pinea TaxID=933095 RepID=A0AAI8YGY7_9PEZI|nr:Uu.00g116260.m01.CDS01 [Anthostomella pinea]
MAENGMNSVNVDSMEEALHRLSKKPGVKAWLMLDRTNGAVLKTNGQIAAVRPVRSIKPETALPMPTSGSFSTDVNVNTNNETQAAQELASMVWSFLSTAGSLVDEMDSEDELKLLRLRTKKQEFVIVPEPKYLLVVIHDTPPA